MPPTPLAGPARDELPVRCLVNFSGTRESVTRGAVHKARLRVGARVAGRAPAFWGPQGRSRSWLASLLSEELEMSGTTRGSERKHCSQNLSDANACGAGFGPAGACTAG